MLDLLLSHGKTNLNSLDSWFSDILPATFKKNHLRDGTAVLQFYGWSLSSVHLTVFLERLLFILFNLIPCRVDKSSNISEKDPATTQKIGVKRELEIKTKS